MYAVTFHGVEAFRYSTREQCLAEMLVRGWIADIERFGCVYAKGVELHKVEE